MRGTRKVVLALLLALGDDRGCGNRPGVGRRLHFGAALRQPSIRVPARAAPRLAPGAGTPRAEAARPPGDPLGGHLGVAGRRRRRLRPRTGGRDRAAEDRGRPAIGSGVHRHGSDALAPRDRRSSAPPRHRDRGADPAPGAPPTGRTDPCAGGPLDGNASLNRPRPLVRRPCLRQGPAGAGEAAPGAGDPRKPPVPRG